jgi:carbonic anhydrase
MRLPELEPLSDDLPAEVFGSKTELLSKLGQSKEPIATLVTCWELGGTPHELSHAKPGEVMVVQNLGGLVAAAGRNENEAISDSILYCLHQPGVQHLIVCGHTQCKTLAALLGNDANSTLDVFRQSRESVSRRFEELYINRPECEWLALIAQESVLLQLANLCGHAAIRPRLRNGSLRLHGWMRDDDTSVIAAFDPASGQFSD